MIVNITNANFSTEVENSKGVVIVDFYGTWCMPCKFLMPILEKIENEKNIKLAKVDIDENEDLCRKFNIVSVPTLKIYKDGKEIDTIVGLVSEDTILEKIK
ncbi:MAG: thioredoxin [Clostridiales bacterium]|nr:thioredoxin [Clostridiales bacterium]